MGTRSRIGIELPDHTVVSVYCHWDGYVEHNGKILVEHYQNREDVQELIDGGSMSSLRTSQTWDSHPVYELDENGEQTFTTVKDENGMSVYTNQRDPQPLYHAERGEDIEVCHTSFDEFVSGNCCEEYAYMYDLNGNWKAWYIGSIESMHPVEIPGYVTA